jgi:hypothetical protein
MSNVMFLRLKSAGVARLDSSLTRKIKRRGVAAAAIGEEIRCWIGLDWH